MYNKVIMMGRICSDPELRTTPNGVNVCIFHIAVDRRFTPKGDEKATDFFNVAAWRQTGDFVNRYFGKGRMILVEGEMQTRQYTDKNGNQSTWYEINAERVSFTGEKAENGEAPAPSAQQLAQNHSAVATPPPTPTAAAAPSSASPAPDYSDDDYPF